MNTFFILYFRENNGNGEYVTFTDERKTKEQAEDYELLGYHFESILQVQTPDETYNLPFESTLLKQY